MAYDCLSAAYSVINVLRRRNIVSAILLVYCLTNNKLAIVTINAEIRIMEYGSHQMYLVIK